MEFRKTLLPLLCWAALLAACSRTDDDESLRQLRREAAQGDAKAQFVLGTMYRLGEGIPKDAGRAVRWYRQAAEQGHAGGNTISGLGMPKT